MHASVEEGMSKQGDGAVPQSHSCIQLQGEEQSTLQRYPLSVAMEQEQQSGPSSGTDSDSSWSSMRCREWR